MGIANEVGKPARRVAGQAADQAQQCSTFGQVERCAQAQVIGADVEGQGDFLCLDIRVELVQQVARWQSHFIELGAVPAVEQNTTAARVVDDGVDTLTHLVDSLVQHHVGLTVFFTFGNLAIALAQAQLDSGHIAAIDLLVGWPLAPLHAIDFAQVVFTLTEWVGQPLGIFVGILVPHLATQGAEICRAIHRAQETAHLANGRFECHAPGGDGREAFLEVIAQHGAGQTDGLHTGAVGLQGAVFNDVGNEVEILLHGFPTV